MKTFTFVTLSYNHKEVIAEHLESIKRIVKKYGDGYAVNFILGDDASKDGTTKVVRRWIRENDFFDKVTILDNKENKGLVANYINSVSYVKEGDFKVLAGDDLYGDFDIFRLYEELDNDTLYVTPVTPYGKYVQSKWDNLESDYKLLMYMVKHGKGRSLMRIDDCIPAPGVFMKSSLILDKKALDYMSRFKFCDDYPLFHYLLEYKGVSLHVSGRSYIYYRIGSGMSTDNKSKIRSAYMDDVKKMRKIIGAKAYILPKYINPYRYYLKVMRSASIRDSSLYIEYMN